MLTILIFFFSFFWNASLPQFEAVTMNTLGSSYNKYSYIRLWGSLGFIISVLSLSFITNKYGIEIVPTVHFKFFIFNMVMSTLFVRNQSNKFQKKHNNSLISINIKASSYWNFSFLLSLMQLSHGPFYAFFAIYLC